MGALVLHYHYPHLKAHSGGGLRPTASCGHDPSPVGRCNTRSLKYCAQSSRGGSEDAMIIGCRIGSFGALCRNDTFPYFT